MKKLKFIATVKEVKHLNNSTMGNPRYLLILEDEQKNTIEAKTQSNSILGYKICYSMEDKKYNFTLHETRAGNLIIDDFR